MYDALLGVGRVRSIVQRAQSNVIIKGRVRSARRATQIRTTRIGPHHFLSHEMARSALEMIRGNRVRTHDAPIPSRLLLARAVPRGKIPDLGFVKQKNRREAGFLHSHAAGDCTAIDDELLQTSSRIHIWICGQTSTHKINMTSQRI
jgi:hypothetical protein